jgi:hypothetical protein
MLPYSFGPSAPFLPQEPSFSTVPLVDLLGWNTRITAVPCAIDNLLGRLSHYAALAKEENLFYEMAEYLLVNNYIRTIPRTSINQLPQWIGSLLRNLNPYGLKVVVSHFGKLRHSDVLFYQAVKQGDSDLADHIYQLNPTDAKQAFGATFIAAILRGDDISAIEYLWKKGWSPDESVTKVAFISAVVSRHMPALDHLLMRTDHTCDYRLDLFDLALKHSNVEMCRHLVEVFGIAQNEVVERSVALIRDGKLWKESVLIWLVQEYSLSTETRTFLLERGPALVVDYLLRPHLSRLSLDELAAIFDVEIRESCERKRCVICEGLAEEWFVVKCCQQSYCRECLDECWNKFDLCCHCRQTSRQELEMIGKSS